MGAKSEYVKRIALRIYSEYKDKISVYFEKNRNLLKQILPGESKKIRNKVAGYLVRFKKREG